MNVPKVFLFIAIGLFGIIACMALAKKGGSELTEQQHLTIGEPIEVSLEEELRSVSASESCDVENITGDLMHQQIAYADPDARKLPEADRIDDLFRKVDPRLPIVETITYKSRVDWLQGRPAWISDYASHYKTSRHFIARSLNAKTDYFKQDVAVGDRFNVLRTDLDISFHLVIDLSRSKMWFYSYCKETGERTLIKTYPVGLGRVDSSQRSGLLTPLGTFTLGDKVAIYKASQSSWYNGVKTEMIRIFGTRWIPFAEEVSGCSAPAKGFGIHGAPWLDGGDGQLVEDADGIGKYQSDGCIRLLSRDMEELFSIVITKPTTVHLVKDFFDAKLPGNES